MSEPAEYTVTGTTLTFTGPETESEDHDETHLVYEFWANAVG